MWAFVLQGMQGGRGVGEVPFQFASAKSEGATDLLFSQNPEMKEKKKAAQDTTDCHHRIHKQGGICFLLTSNKI